MMNSSKKTAGTKTAALWRIAPDVSIKPELNYCNVLAVPGRIRGSGINPIKWPKNKAPMNPKYGHHE
jgi:hypothetical protein